MKQIFLVLSVTISRLLFAQESFQLAPPLLKYGSVFFSDKETVEVKFAQGGTSVHYTLNTREPTELDPYYEGPIIIKKNFETVKAKAFGKNFQPSETVAVTFIKAGKYIQSIQHTAPDIKYPGGGTNTLIDNKGGIEQLNSNTWMGYNCDTVSLRMDMGKQQRLKEVLLDFLQSEGGRVFLPDQVLIYCFDKKSNSFQFFGKEILFTEKETPGSHCNYRLISANRRIMTSKILITILVKKNIPAWHPANGEHAWMFIDEIKVY